MTHNIMRQPSPSPLERGANIQWMFAARPGYVLEGYVARPGYVLRPLTRQPSPSPLRGCKKSVFYQTRAK